MTATAAAKYLDLRELIDSGVLQEANRQFFHPLGLALEVMVEDDGRITCISGVWDYREDPEGVMFGANFINNDRSRAKAEAVERLRRSKVKTRMNLGCDSRGVQPILGFSEVGTSREVALAGMLGDALRRVAILAKGCRKLHAFAADGVVSWSLVSKETLHEVANETNDALVQAGIHKGEVCEFDEQPTD